MPLLKARGVRERFGGVTALDGCGRSIEPGHVIGLMGCNAAGKSALLTMLLGEIRPGSCDILPEGRSVLDGPTHRIARSGAASAHQVPQPFRQLTVAQNIQVAAPAQSDRMCEMEHCSGRARRQGTAARPRPQAPGATPWGWTPYTHPETEPLASGRSVALAEASGKPANLYARNAS
jgi:ABC-type branched-subunit amino acid transport system ATPase component